MNLINQIQDVFAVYLKKAFSIELKQAQLGNFILNVDSAKQQFGDLSSNTAMILAKPLQRNPRDIAQEIIDTFKHPAIKKMEIAGPGFINAFLTDQALQQIAQELVQQKEDYFKLSKDIPRQLYDIEFVSANPTGPLHFGHGRGGIIGDVLGNILQFLGHNVAKEFYINDAGTQIQKLGTSFKIRCQQVLGKDILLPEDGYHGEYLLELAKKCIDEYGSAVLEKQDSFFIDYAKEQLLNQIKGTLEQYGIHFDIWFSEKKLHDEKLIEKAVQFLEEHGYLYEKDGALWFTSTRFGDDKDRVIRKKDGNWTYVAADLAYLHNKVKRGFDQLIMVLGHDHHSYALRLQNVRKALQITPPLDVILYQLVNIKQAGKLIQMSKRAGKMITLADVIDAVGKDVARFFYLHRKADAPLDFDLDLALKKTEENPVYYVQYAYVRTKSMLEKAFQEKALQNITIKDAKYLTKDEALLIKKIASLKSLLEAINKNHQVHLLAYYVIELADLFHKYYSKHRVINLDNIPQSRARLLLIMLLRETFATVLKIMGISQPERM